MARQATDNAKKYSQRAQCEIAIELQEWSGLVTVDGLPVEQRSRDLSLNEAAGRLLQISSENQIILQRLKEERTGFKTVEEKIAELTRTPSPVELRSGPFLGRSSADPRSKGR